MCARTTSIMKTSLYLGRGRARHHRLQYQWRRRHHRLSEKRPASSVLRIAFLNVVAVIVRGIQQYRPFDVVFPLSAPPNQLASSVRKHIVMSGDAPQPAWRNKNARALPSLRACIGCISYIKNNDYQSFNDFTNQCSL